MFNTFTQIFKSLDIRLREVTQETPITIISLISLFFVLSFSIHDESNIFMASYLVASSLTLMFAVLFGYIIHKMLGKSRHWASLAIVLVSSALYYMFIPKNMDLFYSDTWYTLLFLNGCLVLILLVTPFVVTYIQKKPEGNSVYYDYMLRVVVTLFQAIFVSGAFFLLTAAAFGALNLLFNVSIPGSWFMQVFVFAAVIIAPLFWLTEMKGEFVSKKTPLTFLKTVILYIGIPFVSIYMLILYAYSLRVLININNWPEASISWLIIIFSIFGWLLFIASYRFKEQVVIESFRKVFPYVALPQTVMLFYAMYLRIAEYGFTIDRYLVLAFGVGILFFALYTIFSKQRLLIVYPLGFVVVILVAITGPWGMNNVSEHSQLGQLESRLNSLGILNENTIRIVSEEELRAASMTDKESAVSIIQYLCNNHGCRVMSDLLPESVFQEPESYEDYSSEEYEFVASAYTILENIGLNNIYLYGESSSVEQYSLFSNRERSWVPISEYAEFTSINSYSREESDESKRVELTYRNSAEQSVTVDITDQYIAFMREHAQVNREFDRSPADVSAPLFEIEGIAVYFQSAFLEIEDGEVKGYSYDGFLFVK